MRIIIAVCVFMGICAVCEGCTCVPPLNPIAFGCRSDFIIIAEVRSDIMAPFPMDAFNWYYRIRIPDISQIYKFRGSMAGINFRRVYTAEHSGLCGVRLERGWHVLSGSIDTTRRRLTLNNCVSWIDRFPLSMQAQALLNRFARNDVDCSPFE